MALHDMREIKPWIVCLTTGNHLCPLRPISSHEFKLLSRPTPFGGVVLYTARIMSYFYISGFPRGFGFPYQIFKLMVWFGNVHQYFSYIIWRSVLLVEETRGPENH
jgi:hypothetical protein